MSKGPATRVLNSGPSTSMVTPAQGGRPAVLSLAIKERAALYAAYMPFVRNGGIFVPTGKSYKLGDEVFLILTLMGDPAKIPIAGKVVWIAPGGSGASGQRQPGIGVQFPADEAGTGARSKIEVLLGGALKSSRPTHTI